VSGMIVWRQEAYSTVDSWLAKLRSGVPPRATALLGDSIVYLAGAGLLGIGNVILLPLYTRYLSTVHFGQYALLDAIILVVVTIAQLGMSISYLKWYADLDESRRPQLLGSAVEITILSAVLGGIVLFGIVASMREFAAGIGRLTPWLLLVVVPLESLQGLLMADLRARRRSAQFGAAAVIRLLVMIVASIWLVASRRLDIPGVMLGRVIADAAGIAMLGALSLRHAAWRFDRKMVFHMIPYGLPLVCVSLVPVGLDAFGRYLLARYAGLDQVAVYTVALKISNVMQVGFVQPFGTAWGGMMFQIVHDRNSNGSVSKLLNHTFLAGMTIAAAIIVASPVVLTLFGHGVYAQAVKLIPWLLLVPALRILDYKTSLGLYLGHRTGLLAVTAAAGAALNVGLLFLVVPHFGAFGAALAWVLPLAAMVYANSYLSKPYYRLPDSWGVIGAGLAVWAAGAAGAGFIPVEFSARSLSLVLAACAATAVPFLVYCARGLAGTAERYPC
jgi:O-antigen/teichoic acid export membrane protein